MKKKTSFQKSQKWYDKIVGEKGHYYHQSVIIPSMLQEGDFHENARVLDLGCGQGVFSRHLKKGVEYTGVDLSSSLIDKAKKYRVEKNHRFVLANACEKLPIKERDFTHGTMILSLQNMEEPKGAIHNLSHHLVSGAKVLIVLNHPCFRIPRQSDWDVDEGAKVQYRKMNLYMSDQKIPIKTHPGQKDSPITYSFHHPISFYTDVLHKEGFVVEKILELCSDKKSEGGRAKMENRARLEFPLFLTFIARLEKRGE